jgi:hypothetical protein
MSLSLLFVTAMVLGLRHGVDWDHIAAILDLAGTASVEPKSRPDSDDLSRPRFLVWLTKIKLPLLYATGHAFSVLALGVGALALGAVIPAWLNEALERLVGITLLLLSAYLFYSLYLFVKEGREISLRSRWMIVFAAVSRFSRWIRGQICKHCQEQPAPKQSWDSKSAILIGVLHGLGGETGTQVMLFASIAGTAGYLAGPVMLGAFTAGVFVSTAVLGLLIGAGLSSTRFFKPAMVVLGIAAAVFSLIVGILFTFGASEWLPAFN